MRPTLDSLKQSRDGHLWALPPMKPREWPKSERDERGHTFVTLYPNAGAIEYAPKGCSCAECGGRS